LMVGEGLMGWGRGEMEGRFWMGLDGLGLGVSWF
jgi:hypothetical protein